MGMDTSNVKNKQKLNNRVKFDYLCHFHIKIENNRSF